jgi:hypothetical protein
VHELRATDLAAVEEMKTILTSGRIVATGIIDGKRVHTDPRWWWLSSLRLPLAEATLRIIDPPGASGAKVRSAAEITTEGTRAIDPAAAPDLGRLRRVRAQR